MRNGYIDEKSQDQLYVMGKALIHLNQLNNWLLVLRLDYRTKGEKIIFSKQALLLIVVLPLILLNIIINNIK